MKKTMLVFAIIFAMFAFGGCADTPPAQPAPVGTPAVGAPASPDAIPPETIGRAAVILGVGGLGDMGFNDLVYAGMRRAEAELGVPFDFAEPQQIADFEIIIRDMASSGLYDIIVNVGFNQIDPLILIAPEFPDQVFALIDGVVDAPNVISYISREEEGSFLVGALAGLMAADAETYGLNDSNVLGFVGAVENPLIVKFYSGFSAGAQFVNPDISVLSDFIGGATPFSDTTTAREMAIAQNARGADIVFHAAGGSGMGVFAAARDMDFFAIGVNANQNHIDPDHIIASMLKRVDTAAFEAVRAAVVDRNPAVGTTIVLGLVEDGVGYTLEYSNISVSPSIVAVLEDLRARIISGELVVPETREEVASFLANNIFN